MLKIIALICLFLLPFYIMRRFANREEVFHKNVASGDDFLSKNKATEGVHTSESGLQYIILEKGGGDTCATLSDRVRVHYHGELLDGHVFDSSMEHQDPVELKVSEVIEGWQEALQNMVVGDKAKLFVPNHLAYGKNPVGDIPPGSVLIFDLHLLEIL